MSQKRDLKLDLFALAMLVAVVFLALSLVTYDPADPVPPTVLEQLYQPDVLVYPRHDEATNACGPWGALAADLLLSGFGLGAFYLIVSLAAFDFALLRRRSIDTPWLRTAGWITSLVGLVAIAAILMPALSPGPVIGAGGYLGAVTAAALQLHFATAGGLILAASLLLGGLFLCTEYLLLRIATTLVIASVVVVDWLWQAVPVRRRRKTAVDQAESDDADGAEADDEDPAIRIGGRPADAAAEEASQDDVAADTDEPESVEPDEEPAEPLVVKKKAAKKKVGRRSDGPHFAVSNEKDSLEREKVMTQLDEASQGQEPDDYELPKLDLLLEGDEFSFDEQEKEVRRKAKILEKTFAEFGFQVRVVEIETGPVIAQYEVQLEAGLRLSKITSLADDLAIALRVPSVRIVAPIPGKNTVGIEVPNEQRQVVRLREVMEEGEGITKKMRIPLFLGKDVSGSPLAVDLSTLPHLLIAGRTGTGKSVCLNAIISSILMTRRPDEVRMLMIDPKMVELSGYGRLPHLMHPVVTDMRKAEAILAWAVEKMEERYSLLAKAGVRHISSYNQLGEQELMERLEPEDDEQRKAIPLHLPFIVIVADEMADLMMTAGKEVEQHIIRLAQKSRAVGIHLILATQKPTVDVITGLIKSNLPARIAFQVASRTDSRVVLDEMGAEKLLGNGDMLFLWPGTSSLLRGQGTYLSDDEIDSIVDCVSTHEQHFVHELVNIQVNQPGGEPGKLENRDELYSSAVDIVVREGRGSVSLLQRTLGIGYGRAARLIDFMAEDNIVGAYAGSQAREVLITVDDWERMQGNEVEPDEQPAPAPKRRRSTKVKPDADESTQPRLPAPKSQRKKVALTGGSQATNDEEEDDLWEDQEDDATAQDEPPWDEEENDEWSDEESSDADADDDEEYDESEDEYEDYDEAEEEDDAYQEDDDAEEDERHRARRSFRAESA